MNAVNLGQQTVVLSKEHSAYVSHAPTSQLLQENESWDIPEAVCPSICEETGRSAFQDLGETPHDPGAGKTIAPRFPSANTSHLPRAAYS